jgi:hypothetical protein
MNQKNEFREFSIRVPHELFQKLSFDALESRRSRNLQVVFILEEHYDVKEEKTGKATAAAENEN